MKLFTLLFALFTVFCVANALIAPAIAQQTAAQPAPAKQKDGAAPASTSDEQPRNHTSGRFALDFGQSQEVISSVEGKQTTARDDIGDARAYELAPSEPQPPQVTVQWGPRGSTVPTGVVEGIGTRYTMFGPSGATVRATTNVELSEAEKAAQKQATPDEDAEDDD